MIGGNALTISVYTQDRVLPELVSFASLNLETGQMSLIFSEAVNVSTIRPQAISLQTLFEMPLQSYNLTGGSVRINANGTAVNISLNAEDINFINESQDSAPHKQHATSLLSVNSWRTQVAMYSQLLLMSFQVSLLEI